MSCFQTRLSAGLASALALLAGGAFAAPADPPSTPAAARQTGSHRTYSAAEFFETTSFGLPGGAGLAFSPDGQSILISSDRSGVFNAYVLPIHGGEPTALTTSTTNATYAQTWFPRDGRILVAADGGGDERSHVYVREVDGSLRDLTPGDRVTANLIGWNQDRSVIWVASNARDPSIFDILAIDPTTYESRLLYQNPGMAVGAISADGRWVVLEKQTSNDDNDLYLVDLAQPGEPHLITAHAGAVRHKVFDFTSDSRALIFGSDGQSEFGRAYRYDLAAGVTTEELRGEWDVTTVVFSLRAGIACRGST